MSEFNDPIDNIQWLKAEELTANLWNPNIVHTPELKLLEHNILTIGFVQPVLISKGKTIIDGFHRTMLSRDSKAIKARYKGRVPCVVLDIDEAEAKLLTVRMNRAKGTHVATRMSELVKSLIDEHGMAREDIMKGIGATKDEIDLLYQDGVFKAKNLKDYKYSKAWRPIEVPAGAVDVDAEA